MAQGFDVTQSLFSDYVTPQQRADASALAQANLGGLGMAQFQAARSQESARQQIPKLFGQQSEEDVVQDVRNKNLPILQSQGKMAYLDAIIADFSARGLGNKAFLAQQLKDQVAQKEAESQATIGLKQAQAAKAGKEQGPKFANEVDKALYEDFLIKANGNAGVAARMYSEYKSGLRQKEAKAGVPESGAVKIQDIASANKIISELVDTPKQKLSTVADVKTQLNLVRKGEGAALPQLQRQLIKLVGDSQIAQGEVRAALGSAGIVGDTINAVNQFMTGVPTADKLDSVEKVINALEEINADAYNRGRNRAATVINEAAFSDQTKKALLPPEYKTGKQKKTQFVEGKIYTDAKGNRARYVNGKWEPVQ